MDPHASIQVLHELPRELIRHLELGPELADAYAPTRSRIEASTIAESKYVSAIRLAA